MNASCPTSGGGTSITWCTVANGTGRYGLWRYLGTACSGTGRKVADYLTTRERVQLHRADRRQQGAQAARRHARRQPDADEARARLLAAGRPRAAEQHPGMTGRLLNRLKLRSERGLALPLTVLVLASTGATVVTVVEYSSSSGRTAQVGESRVSAQSLAEAAIANAFAVLNNRGRPQDRRHAADAGRRQSPRHDGGRHGDLLGLATTRPRSSGRSRADRLDAEPDGWPAADEDADADARRCTD